MKKKASTKSQCLKEDSAENKKMYATVALKPSLLATSTIREFTKILGDLDISSLNANLSDETLLINSGKLQRVESMLFTQATALESIFHGLALRANSNKENMDLFERLLRLGLKAQSQSRATLETLGKIKNPQPIAFVRQANIAHGHQQVNNGVSPLAQEILSAPNELLEVDDGKRMDTRTACSTVSTNPQLATVETVHRTD